ncbi:MAG: hypothetical protein PF488_03990 [Patescibacteria group bacterium]|jgi:hypothetical protein|nr:hypothetical protein [Patescibacteria group bacterium]
MSVITNLINTNDGSVSMGVINTNIDNLNTDKLEAADITGIDETQLDVSVNASLDLADSASQATGVENNADVTDVTNVTTAGALMDSEVTNLAQVKAFDTTDYATSAQGSTADSALQTTDKATGTELNTGTDDAKYATAKALDDSNYGVRTATFVLIGATTDLAIDTAIGGDFRIPGNRAITITKVGAYVDTAGTTGVTTIDINEGGTSILSTKITIDTTEKTSQTAATAPAISDTAIAADAILTFDIDGISTTAPKGLKIYIEFTY